MQSRNHQLQHWCTSHVQCKACGLMRKQPPAQLAPPATDEALRAPGHAEGFCTKPYPLRLPHADLADCPAWHSKGQAADHERPLRAFNRPCWKSPSERPRGHITAFKATQTAQQGVGGRSRPSFACRLVTTQPPDLRNQSLHAGWCQPSPQIHGTVPCMQAGDNPAHRPAQPALACRLETTKPPNPSHCPLHAGW